MQKAVSMNFVVKIKVVEEVKLYINSWVSAQSVLWESSYEKNIWFFATYNVFCYFTIFELCCCLKLMKVGSGLPQALFLVKTNIFWNMIFLKLWINDFWEKCFWSKTILLSSQTTTMSLIGKNWYCEKNVQTLIVLC